MKLRDLHEICTILLKYYPDTEVSSDKDQLELAQNDAERVPYKERKSSGVRHPVSSADEVRLRSLGIKRTFMDDGWGYDFDDEDNFEDGE